MILFQCPDFNGIHISNLDSLLDTYDLRYIIIDSVFDKTREKG